MFVSVVVVSACSTNTTETTIDVPATAVNSSPSGVSSGASSTTSTSTIDVGFPVPDYAEPPDEFAFVLECMAWYGFSGTVDRTGDGLLFDTPPDQMEKYVGAISDCSTKYRILAGMTVGLPDEDTLRDWYQALLLTYECLLEHDYPVSPLPSEDAWIESRGTIWHPYGELASLDEAGANYSTEFWEELESTCPQDIDVLLGQLDQ